MENTVAENNSDEFNYVNESGDLKQYFPNEFKDRSLIWHSTKTGTGKL